MLPTWAIQLIFIGALIGGVYWYYTSTQAEIAQLRDTVVTLEMINETNEATIKTQKRALEYNAKAYADLTKRNQETEVYKDNLIKIFQEHDLQRLSIAKPGLIERRINDATRKVFDDLESVTTPE